MSDRAALDPVTRTIFAVLGIAAGVWSTWVAVIAFTGGTVPLVGWRLEGGPLFGLWFLFTIDPLVMTIAWVAFLFVGLLIVSMARAVKTLTQLARGQR